jgi:hypothetical protein
MQRHETFTWLLPMSALFLVLAEIGAQEKARDSEPTLAALQRLGCEVKAHPKAGQPGLKVLFAGCEDLDRALPHLRNLRDLRAVDL